MEIKTNLLFGNSTNIIAKLTEGSKCKICRLLFNPKSEDAVTWNVFNGLKEDSKNLTVNATIPQEQITIPFKTGELILWNLLLNSGEEWEPLKRILPKIEAGKSKSEIDAIIVEDKEKKVYFFENKLTSEKGPCKAIDDKKKCRLYRNKKKGCSYWGEGNETFKKKYNTDYIQLYFKSDFRKPESLTDKEADCYKYYQLMRNWIIGNELVKFEGLKGYTFYLCTILRKQDIIPEEYLDYRNKLINPERFYVLTWQDIINSLEDNNRVKNYLKSLLKKVV